jgi:hypothetical protein
VTPKRDGAVRGGDLVRRGGRGDTERGIEVGTRRSVGDERIVVGGGVEEGVEFVPVLITRMMMMTTRMARLVVDDDAR